MTMTTAPSPSASPPPPAAPSPEDRPWFNTPRPQDYRGEEQANRPRTVAVTALSLNELANDYGVNFGFVQVPRIDDRAYRQAVTAVALAWVILALGVHLCLGWQVLPAGLKYAMPVLDVVLLTVL